MATTNDLKNGIVLKLDGQLWTVTDFQHVKPGKGGAFVRTTLKNVLSGKVVDKTFNAGLKVETATVDKRNMTFLYKDGADFVFMDGDTFDQITVPAATVGGARRLPAREHRGHGRGARRRAAVRGAPGDHGARGRVHRPGPAGRPSTGGTKPATLETGAQIKVPLFIPPARSSRSTPATAGTSAGATEPKARPMAARTKARKRALDVLYEADVRSRDRRRCSPSASRTGTAGPDYTVGLVEGVDEHSARIDALIDAHASGWSIDRMPDVDRRSCASRSTSCSGPTMSPTPSRSTRRWSWPRAVHRRLPAYVNGVLGAILAAEVPTPTPQCRSRRANRTAPTATNDQL